MFIHKRRPASPLCLTGIVGIKCPPFLSTVRVLSFSGFFLVDPKVLCLVTTDESVEREIFFFFFKKKKHKKKKKFKKKKKKKKKKI